MLRAKPKTCKGCQNERQIFGHGLCKYCYDKERALRSIEAPQPPSERVSPLKVYKPPLKAKSPLKRRSDKRIDQEKEYKKICDEMDAAPGKKMCFLCGLEIKGKKWHHHHLDGREEHYLTRGLIVLVHPKCHAMLHDVSIHKWPWRIAYLDRLRMRSPQLYEREILKLDK